MSWSPSEGRWKCARGECEATARPRWVPGFEHPENLWPLGMCEAHVPVRGVHAEGGDAFRELTEEEAAMWEVMSR